MTIPAMSNRYQAKLPAHYAEHFKANAEEMAARAAEATNDTWREFCIRQQAFWTRQAARAV